MKLISYNIAIFIDNSQEISDFLLKQDPDIVAFQEIIRHFDNSVLEKYKSKEHIEKRIKSKLPFSFFGPQWITDVNTKNGTVYRNYGGFIEQGNQISSRFPIINARNEHYHKTYEYNADRTHFYEEDHPRCVQIVDVKINNKIIQIINLHGTHTIDKKDTDRSLKQSEYILNIARKRNIPTIITGDFNLLPETKSIKMINTYFRNLVQENNIVTTRPNREDKKEIRNTVVDYIFVSKDIKVNRFEVANTPISDHLPLILEFELK